MDTAKTNPHVAFFIGAFGGGGVERITARLAHGLVKQGVKKIDLVVDKRLEDESHLQLLPPEVQIVDLQARNLYTSLPKLVKYLQREQPDALISAMHYQNEIAIWAKWISRAKTRVIVSEHNQLSKTVANAANLKNRLTPFFAKLFYPWADAILAVSEGIAEDLSHLAHLPLERISVIYNPVITPELIDKAKEPIDHPWFRSGEPPVILGVGKLEEQKDFPNLIRAFAHVRRIRPARLMILGWGPDRSKLETLIRELNLEADVAMPGYEINPYAYMARSALFVLSSAWEGLPTVLIEAIAIGVPVVSTDCESGPREILDNGKYGLLTPVGNSDALSKAILKTLSDQDKSVDSAWLDQFSLETATQKYLDILGIS